MALSLNLPFSVCYPLVKFARKLKLEQRASVDQDQDAYFQHQYASTHRLRDAFMEGLDLRGRTILDIGCGLGGRALAWLDAGATRVINIDINRQELARGKQILAEHYGAKAHLVEYRHPDEVLPSETGDIAIMFDCFEHLMEPAAVLKQTYHMLRPGGIVWIGSIGWYNYLASHCVGGHIPIPWCQLLFSEHAIIQTIRTIVRSPGYVPNLWERLEGIDRWDNVKTLKDRPGEPLNMLSLRQVRSILRQSDFTVREFRVFGFGGRRNRWTSFAAPLAKVPLLDELMHSYYAATLVKE